MFSATNGAPSPSEGSLRHELGRAMRVGMLGGALLGVREAFVTLEANATVQPTRYVLGYIAVPILSWVGLGVLIATPVAFLVAWRRRRGAPTASFAWYAGALALAGSLSAGIASLSIIEARMALVGAPPGLLVRSILWTLLAAGCAAVAAVVTAAADRIALHEAAILRHGQRALAAILLLCLIPVVRFFATEWRWTLPGTGSTMARATSGTPNVVVVSIDTIRADHVGRSARGPSLTPNLDRIADDGIAFTNAFTTSPWTLPAMASFFTGLVPHRHHAGATTNGRDPLARSALPVSVWTMTSALRQLGLRTQAIVTNPYLALAYGLGGSFDSFQNLSIESELFVGSRDTTLMRLVTTALPAIVSTDRGGAVSDRAVGWLDAHGTDAPFFLWVHYVDPHAPYSAGGRSRNKSFRGDSVLGDAPAGPEPLLTSPDVARLRSGEIRLNAQERDTVRALYADEIRGVDEAAGRVIQALDRLGLRDSTLVVVVGDHGEEFWEHGGVEHGHTVYDEVLRVPLIMRWPGHLPAGRRVDSLCRITDVAPTVLDLLGAPVPPDLDGTSLVGVVQGTDHAERTLVAENMLFSEERVGIRTDAWKYVRWATGKSEAYDLTHDPGEQRDVAADPVVRARLDALLPAASLGAAAAGEAPPPHARDAESLRKLGYIQ